jgi:amidohydrolase
MDSEQPGAVCASAVRRDADDLLELSHALHARPELAFQEHHSAAAVAGLAARNGFDVRRGVAGLETAFVASYGSGPLVLALCAEYDALPEVGHACGHNVIAAASSGAAFALRDVADRLGLTVKLIGTPAEEAGGGKVLMLERGVFDGVGAAMMVHPAPDETCASGSLAIADFEVRYTGKESHAAAAPQLGLNAADALTVAQVSVGLLRQHLDPGQMIHGIVTHGGAAPNIVPAATSALYYLRAGDLESLRRLETRVRACFAAGSIATGCHEDVAQVSPAYTELAPDPWLAAAYRSAVTGLGRTPMSPDEERNRRTGSTDMGNITRAMPGIHPMIKIESGDAVNHQPEFAAACASPSADRAVLDGALALALTGVAAATDPAQRARLIDGAASRGRTDAGRTEGADGAR